MSGAGLSNAENLKQISLITHFFQIERMLPTVYGLDYSSVSTSLCGGTPAESGPCAYKHGQSIGNT